MEEWNCSTCQSLTGTYFEEGGVSIGGGDDPGSTQLASPGKGKGHVIVLDLEVVCQEMVSLNLPS